MKSILILVISVFVSACIYGQVSDPKPGSPIPAFRMLQTNGSYYSDKQIPKNKSLGIIYFAPDCDHCIKLMDELFKKIHQLDKTTLVMITFKPVGDLPWFEKRYRTASFPNIHVGTEGTSYVLRNFYRLDKTPFIAGYNRNGKLTFSYKNETPVPELLSRFKKL